jgi:hypothetical protein
MPISLELSVPFEQALSGGHPRARVPCQPQVHGAGGESCHLARGDHEVQVGRARVQPERGDIPDRLGQDEHADGPVSRPANKNSTRIVNSPNGARNASATASLTGDQRCRDVDTPPGLGDIDRSSNGIGS